MKDALYFDVSILAFDGIAYQSDFENEDLDKLLKCFIDFLKFADFGDEFSVVASVKE